MNDNARFLVTTIAWTYLVGLLLTRVQYGISMFTGAVALGWLLMQALRKE
mgnify:CR=1